MGALAFKKSASLRLHNLIKSYPAISFTRPDCYANKSISELFAKIDVDLKTVDLTKEPIDLTYELLEFTKKKDVPQIFIDSKFIGGAEELKKSFKDNSLYEMLKEANVPWKHE